MPSPLFEHLAESRVLVLEDISKYSDRSSAAASKNPGIPDCTSLPLLPAKTYKLMRDLTCCTLHLTHADNVLRFDSREIPTRRRL